jgi:hypothetical protein
MHAKSFTALLILSTAMAAPSVENTEGEISAGGVYSNDYIKGPDVNAELAAANFKAGRPGKDAFPAGDKDVKPPTPATAPSVAAPAKAPAGSAAPGGTPSAPSGPAAPPAAPKDAPKDVKDSKDADKDKAGKPAGKPVEKGAVADGFVGGLHVEGGSYEHSEGAWGFEGSWNDGKDCDKCKPGGDKKPEPPKGGSGDKPGAPGGTSTSCSTDVPSPTPPPKATTASPCPLASGTVTPCNQPKAPQSPVAKQPDGETRPPPAQVGNPPSATPPPSAGGSSPARPESPNSPNGAKSSPKATPSKPATYKSAAGALVAAGPLAQMAIFGVVSYAVAALIL